MSKRELLTAKHRDKLLANAIAGEMDHPPVVKLFTPDANATWLISEVDPDDPDRLFGLCDLGLGYPELGYVSLAELLALRGPLGLPSNATHTSFQKHSCRSTPTWLGQTEASSPNHVKAYPSRPRRTRPITMTASRLMLLRNSLEQFTLFGGFSQSRGFSFRQTASYRSIPQRPVEQLLQPMHSQGHHHYSSLLQ
jgi:hypothetical protein